MSPRFLMTYLAHLAVNGLIVVAALLPVSLTLALVPALMIPGAVLLIADAAALLLFLIATVLHERLMCSICAAMTPLPGEAAAAKHDRRLRRYHNPWSIIWALISMVAVPGVAILLHLSFVVGQLGTSMVLVFIALEVRAFHVHRVLAPWCPYCRRYRRWEDDGAPEPSPDPAPSTELPV